MHFLTVVARRAGRSAIHLVAGATLCVLSAPATGQLPPSALAGSRQDAGSSEPLNIRRVLIPPERVPIELQKAKQKLFIEIPREEFEAYVDRAAQVEESLRKPVRLRTATYRAVLAETYLSGTADWSLENPNAALGILRVEPLNLAIRDPKLGDSDAILGELAAQSFGLIVEKQGSHRLKMDWSARGEEGPDGLRFDLRVPACTLSSFEFDLPADCKLLAPRDTTLLTGPYPAARPDRRLWRLVCSATAPADLVVRRALLGGPKSGLLLVRSHATQILAPEGIDAVFDLNLEVLHGSVKELICECAPMLKPIKISSRNATIENWEVIPGGSAGSGSRLKVRFRNPFEDRFLHLGIQCRGSSVLDGVWKCGGLHVAGAISLRESISLRIASGIHMRDWKSGDFDLIKATSDADGSQTLTLHSGLWGGAIREKRMPAEISTTAEALRQRPSARLELAGGEFRVRQFSWWQVGGERSTLVVDLVYDQLRGRTFRLKSSLPAGWKLNEIESIPAGGVRSWYTSVSPSGATELIVDLDRAMEPGTNFPFRLVLVPEKETTSSRVVDFPQVMPLGARSVEGVFAIRLDPRFRAAVETDLSKLDEHSARRAPADHGSRSGDDSGNADWLQRAPWGEQQPDYAYRYRDRSPTGTLSLQARQPRVRARCTSDVVLAPGRAVVTSRLQLDPQFGQLSSVDLYVSAPAPDHWTWNCGSKPSVVPTARQLMSRELMPLLSAVGTRHALAAALSLSDPFGNGSYWRLTFNEPLNETVTLESTVTLADRATSAQIRGGLATLASSVVLDASGMLGSASRISPQNQRGRSWPVPLVSVLGSEFMEGHVDVHLAGLGFIELKSAGLEEVQNDLRSGSADLWRTYRYRNLPVSLELVGQTPIVARLPQPHIDRARLATYVMTTQGRLLHRFGFQVQSWSPRTLPVQLPPAARFLAARLDRRWIQRVSDLTGAHQPPVVELPVAEPSLPHYFEIYYSTLVPSWKLWTRINAPAPALPLEPVAVERQWCLPSDVTPLTAATLRRVPGSEGNEMLALEELALVKSLALSRPWSLSPLEWKSEQERLFSEAATRFPSQFAGRRDVTLSDVLSFLVFDIFQDSRPIVVDTSALAETGLTPLTPIANGSTTAATDDLTRGSRGLFPTLQTLGIAFVPNPTAPIITNEKQSQAWSARSYGERPPDEWVQSAVAEAIANGQDASGRFRDAVDWLSGYERHLLDMTPAAQTKSSALRPDSVSRSEHLDAWTEWQPIAGTAPEAEILLMSQQLIVAIECGLLLILLFAAWRLRNLSWHKRYGLLVLWLSTAVAGIIWLPGDLSDVARWQIFLGASLGAGWYLWSILTSANARHIRSAGPITAMLGGIIVGLGLPSRADEPPPPTVLLLPGPASAPAQQTVLLSPQLLERLKSIALRLGREPVLLGAHYRGNIADGGAEFRVGFRIHSFTDAAVAVSLPLEGIDLQEVLLDGKTAYPEPDPRRAGYRVMVSGKGSHLILARCIARINKAGDKRELRFSVPELAENRLDFTAPRNVKFLQAAIARGAQWTDSDSAGIQLHADLGRVNTVQVRWFEARTSPQPADVSVREIYYWDIGRSAARLLGVLQYQIARGAPTSFAVNLPEDMEVRRVEAEYLKPGLTVLRLKSWTVEKDTANVRRLRLDFAAPVMTPIQLFVELFPRLPLGPRPILVLPSPDGASSTESFLAFRVDGHEANISEHRRITGIEPSVFAAIWQRAGVDDLGAPERAYSFRRAGGDPPFLQVELKPWWLKAECTQEVTCRLGPQEALVEASAKITSPRENLVLLDWEVPEPVQVADVNGDGVRSWSRSGSHVQIWLERGLGVVTLKLNGVAKYEGKDPSHFTLPCLHFPETSSHSTIVNVFGEPSVTFSAEHLQQIVPLPNTAAPNREFTLLSNQAPYAGTFKIQRIESAPKVRALMPVETRDRNPQFASKVEKIKRGEVRDQPAQLIYDEQAAAVVDGQSWLHRATYWLYPGSGTDVSLSLPGGAALVRMLLDGREVSTAETPSGRYWLPVIGGSRTRRVTLYWKFAAGEESFDQPRFQKPIFDKVVNSAGDHKPASVWIIYLPAGFRTTNIAGNASLLSRSDVDLRRAAAQFSLSQLLAFSIQGKVEQSSEHDLDKAQLGFYRYCRYAEYHLGISSSKKGGSGEAFQLTTLLAANKRLAESMRFEERRAAAEHAAGTRGSMSGTEQPVLEPPQDRSELDEIFSSKGVPVFIGAATETEIPTLRLVAANARETERRLALSALLVVISLSAWMVSYYPRILEAIKRCWPEQLIAAGCVGWSVLGANWAPVVLILVGVGARLFYAGEWGLDFLRRPRRGLPASPSISSTRLGTTGSS
jgi:hypothetical protein